MFLLFERNLKEFVPHCRIDTRNKFAKFKIPFYKTNMGQKAISFVGPSLLKVLGKNSPGKPPRGFFPGGFFPDTLLNSLPEVIKKTDNLNTFKHNVKRYCLNWINNELMKWVSHCYYFKNFTILTLNHYIFVSYTLDISFYFFHLSLMFSSLSRGTTMKRRHLYPFCAVPAISIAVHISVTNSFLLFNSF